MIPTYSAYRDLFRGTAFPYAFVDLDLFDKNVAQVLARAPGARIRVASKSLRCPALIQRVLDSNPAYQGVMSYTGKETAYLCEQGFDDFLIGYPIWHADEVSAVCTWLAKGKRITCMVDCPEQVEHLDREAKEHGVTIPICIDVDMSSEFPGLYFGVRRSPVRTVDDALAIATTAAKSPNIHLHAVMGYEAQIAGLPDKIPNAALKNVVVKWLKSRSIAEIGARRGKIVEALKARGHAIDLVNGGGTGSIESTIKESWVTEVTVGSAFYAPGVFDHYEHFKHLPAVGFAIEVTRMPTKGVYTCAGGGYIASGEAGPAKQPKPYLPDGAKLIGHEGAGEVQTPVKYDGSETIGLGDPIFMRHAKAGEVCERFKSLLAISNGKVIDEYPTYRGDGQCFV